MSQKPDSEAPRWIVREDRHFDDHNRVVIERVVVAGQAPADFVGYIGVGRVKVALPDGRTAVMTDIPFPILKARSLSEAYGLFRSALDCEGVAVAQERLMEMEHQAQQAARQVVTARPA